jgi:hypothetical protein
MPEFRLPLSGDVSQTINPWTMFFRAVGSQFGLININLGKSADPELEQRILADVGSYGRQIGQLGDALKVLLDHVKLDGLKPEEQTALDALRFQLTEIDRLKTKRRAETAAGTVNSSGP